jgi:hypothetical protein
MYRKRLYTRLKFGMEVICTSHVGGREESAKCSQKGDTVLFF